jgi:hypothetical protein
MSLKNAALLALVGSVLLTVLALWNLVFTTLSVVRGLAAPITLFSSLIYAFTGLSVAVFFYIFHKTQV